MGRDKSNKDDQPEETPEQRQAREEINEVMGNDKDYIPPGW